MKRGASFGYINNVNSMRCYGDKYHYFIATSIRIKYYTYPKHCRNTVSCYVILIEVDSLLTAPQDERSVLHEFLYVYHEVRVSRSKVCRVFHKHIG